MERIDGAERAQALLDFWFGPRGSPERERPRAVWFEAQEAFDGTLRQAFGDDQARAAAGQYDHWREAPQTCLALVLLLDQLPRNLYRGTPQAFACDPRARAAARHALARGYDEAVPTVWRWFFYLPFQHSEDIGDQRLCVDLHEALPEDADKADAVLWARRHFDVIARFGRFPHRNRILGRVTTAEEEAFLQQPGTSF